jgi:hypothetical protein
MRVLWKTEVLFLVLRVASAGGAAREGLAA